jgi:hypothetical protein
VEIVGRAVWYSRGYAYCIRHTADGKREMAVSHIGMQNITTSPSPELPYFGLESLGINIMLFNKLLNLLSVIFTDFVFVDVPKYIKVWN